MKKLLFLLLMLPAFPYAQVNLDSLWEVWNDSSKPDTSRLKAMGEISWEGYLFTDTDSAFHFYSFRKYVLRVDLYKYKHSVKSILKEIFALLFSSFASRTQKITSRHFFESDLLYMKVIATTFND